MFWTKYKKKINELQQENQELNDRIEYTIKVNDKLYTDINNVNHASYNKLLAAILEFFECHGKGPKFVVISETTERLLMLDVGYCFAITYDKNGKNVKFDGIKVKVDKTITGWYLK